MSYPEDLCASGTSVFSLTVAARRSYRSASRYWPRLPIRLRRFPKHRRKLLVRSGRVLDVAARWRSWNDSPPLRRASVLPRSFNNEYDLLFLISKLASTTAPAGKDCPPFARSHRRAWWRSPPPSFCPLGQPPRAVLILPNGQKRNSKRISSRCQSGSLQVTVSKTTGNICNPNHSYRLRLMM